MFNSKHKKMLESIKRKKDIGEALTFDETVYELTSKHKQKERERIKSKIPALLVFVMFFISLILSKNSPVIAGVLATFTLFLILFLVLVEDGKIDLNGIHKKEGFGCGVYVLLSLFLPVYYGIYLGYEDKRFESFLINNQCGYIDSVSGEDEYYCSKPGKKISRSVYDYIESNMGFNSDWKK